MTLVNILTNILHGARQKYQILQCASALCSGMLQRSAVDPPANHFLAFQSMRTQLTPRQSSVAGVRENGLCIGVWLGRVGD